MRPICVPCGRLYKCEQNGVMFVQIMKMSKDGKEIITPTKIYMADLYSCPGCGHETIAGVGQNPVAEHYQPNFDQLLEHVKFFIKGD